MNRSYIKLLRPILKALGAYLELSRNQSYKDLQHKFYATLIFKHSDWLKILSSHSKCLKNSVAQNLRCKIFIGLAPGPFFKIFDS